MNSKAKRTVNVANPGDKSFHNGNGFLFAFGAYGSNAPGIFCDDAVNEEYQRAIAEGCSEEEAQERAETDVTVFGHNGLHYIASWEWTIVGENMTPREIAAFAHDRTVA